MSRVIVLTKGKTAIVDDEDFDTVMSHRWRAWKCPHSATRWYAVRRGFCWIPMQNLIAGCMGLVVRSPYLIDHRNRDSLDNRRSNLRLSTLSQNQANADRSHLSTTGYRGVRITTSGRWGAYLKTKGQQRHLGTFSDPISAALAYDTAARELWGDFAMVNFPVGAVRG